MFFMVFLTIFLFLFPRNFIQGNFQVFALLLPTLEVLFFYFLHYFQLLFINFGF